MVGEPSDPKAAAGLPGAPWRFNLYEDFEFGRRFRHHWGRTVTADEAVSFATQNLLHQPACFNRSYAAHLGYPDIVVNSLLVYGIVLGLSVEDLSEAGGPFLGSDGIVFGRPVFPGDTLFASSTVLSRRLSKSNEGYGIVEWRTEGHNQHGERVIAFRRSNLVPRREAAAAPA